MKIYDARSFGNAVRIQRKKLGYTQEYVSHATGMSVSFISDLERGKVTAELEKALSIANLLGLDCELIPRD